MTRPAARRRRRAAAAAAVVLAALAAAALAGGAAALDDAEMVPDADDDVADHDGDGGDGMPGHTGGDGPVSSPVAGGGALPRSKFTERPALAAEDVVGGTDATGLQTRQKCPVHAEIVWSTRLESGVYATPVIDQLHHDAARHILVPAFKRDLHLLDGDGHPVPGEWPFAADDVYFHASPLLLRRRGTPYQDVLWASVNAEIFVVSGDPETGGMLRDAPIHLPKLRVKKDWYEGLVYDEETRTGGAAPRGAAGHGGDHGDDAGATPPLWGDLEEEGDGGDFPDDVHGMPGVERSPPPRLDANEAPPDMGAIPPPGDDAAAAAAPPPAATAPRRRLLQVSDDGGGGDDAAWDAADWGDPDGDGPAWDDGGAFDDVAGLDPEDWEWNGDDADGATPPLDGTGAGDAIADGDEDEEAEIKRRLAELDALGDMDGAAGDDAWLDQLGDGLTDEAKDSFRLFGGGADDAPFDDFGHVDRLDSAGRLLEDFGAAADDEAHFLDEALEAERRARDSDSEYLRVDAHVMSTPVLADVDGDGYEDLVVAVSYFFDEDEFRARPAAFAHLGADVDIKKYVAGGVVVYSMRKRRLLWSEHLDLSTDETRLKAFIYASPTVIDLDGDGGLEVVVGTSLGFVYALDARTGAVLEGFPVVMDEVQAAVSAADVNGDGEVELVATDKRGNVMCFDRHGKEVWEAQVAGFATAAASFGDLDGDGVLDVVLGTTSGQVWALRGDTGKPLAGFPVRTGGKVLAQALLVNLDTEQVRLPGLHAVVPSFDGHVYIIDGRTGCVSKVDLGEQAYAMVLTDDVLGNGKMDLVVSTMSGSVVLLGTEAPYHPLKAWGSHNHRLNGVTAKENYHGVYVHKSTRDAGVVMGARMPVTFEIVDARPPRAGASRLYRVAFYVEGVPVLKETYGEPGTYEVTLPCPPYPAYSTVRVEMYNEHHQHFYDSFAVGFNIRYYRLLKYVLALPFLAMGFVLAYVRPAEESLPGARLD